MAPTQTATPLKSMEDVADEQAHKALALVREADALAAKSGRTRQEELKDMMMARLTQAAIARQRQDAGVVAYKDSVDRLRTFIAANSGKTDPQRIIMNLTTLTDSIRDTFVELQKEPV